MTATNSLLLDQSSPNLMGILQIQYRTQLLCRKLTAYQNSRWRHLEFRKSCCHFFTIRRSPNLVEMLRIWHKTQLSSQKVHIHQNSRWRLPPSWISKSCGQFTTIWPFLTKHVVNIKYRPAAGNTANINKSSNFLPLRHDDYPLLLSVDIFGKSCLQFYMCNQAYVHHVLNYHSF